MTSDINQRSGSGLSGSTADAAKAVGEAAETTKSSLYEAAGREASSAKDLASSAASSIKEGAAGLASAAQSRVSEGAERGIEQMTSSIGDFAAAIRKASDELGARDQSMAAKLVQEVANGLEQATSSIKGSNVQDLTRSVASFARRQPTTFLIGAALAGVALGRFARASGEHAGGSAGKQSQPGRSYVGEASGVSHRGPAGDYATSYANQPRPTEGAYPAAQREPMGSDLGHGSGSFNPAGTYNPVGDDNVR